jgi:hypothetical protein
MPKAPFMLGTWIPGTVLGSHMVQFERPNAYVDQNKPCPDIVVFDSTFAVKYAMDGSVPLTTSGNANLPYRGSIYPWKRQQVTDFDPTTARAVVLPILASTDIVYAFYPYVETDVLYTDLDVNPVTNPVMVNASVQFYFKREAANPYKVIYHQLFDVDGNPIVGQTNDPAPPNWVTSPPTVFGQLVAGATYGTGSFTVTDARVRGGGLAPQYETIPEADNFWDIGYLDGRPYPIGAALVVYLPYSILVSINQANPEQAKPIVLAKVNAIVPMGMLAHIRYYDSEGNESV